MNNRQIFLVAAMALAGLGSGALLAGESGRGSKSYRWTDTNGVTHYGDSVPPEYASQGRAELNPQGVPLREFPKQLSPAEALDAQKAAAEVARRRQRDSFLLSTYTHTRDIEQLRDERLALIDGQMEIARGSIGSTDQRIAGMQVRLRNYMPYSTAPNARRVPDQLAEEIVRALKERRGLQAALDSREAEKNQLRAQFDSDIARYRELTSRPSLR
jgi:hypothetical protein